jgi:hypothetical protein
MEVLMAQPISTIRKFVPTLAAVLIISSSLIAPLLGQNSSLFLPPVSYGSSASLAAYIVLADVNKDGKMDIVVMNGSGYIGVLLGKGNGTFSAAKRYLSYGSITTLVAGDFNRDGNLDLATVNSSWGALDLLFGNGDGTFQPPRSYWLCGGGSWPGAIATGDLNGDGIPDLVVDNATCYNSIVPVLGKGDGTFNFGSYNWSGGLGDVAIALADFNRDGKLDVAAANQLVSYSETDHGTIGILVGDGDGTFKPVITYSLTGTPTSIAAADVNGDGIPDLLVTMNTCSGCNGSVRVFLGNGDATFTDFIGYDTGGIGTNSVTVGDLNKDGKLDLVLTNISSNTISVLFGNGDGTFQHAQTFAVNVPSAYSAAIGDVNGDGWPDVVVADYSPDAGSVSVFLNGLGRPITTLTSNLNPSLYGQKVTFTATVKSVYTIATPTGTVYLTWGNSSRTYTIGTATLNSEGVATFTKSTLNADTYPLVALYTGDANNPLGSASAVLKQTVLQTTSTTRITSSLNPSVRGQAVTFSAIVTSPTVVVTGPVTFKAGATVLGTAQLIAGKATLTTSSLPAGSTIVRATYGGNSNVKGSSASRTQVVQP